MSTAVRDLVANLEQAVKQIRGEAKREQEGYEARRADLLHREELVAQAIEGLRESKTLYAPRPADLSISPDKVSKVIEYLRKRGRARQTEIAAKSGLNTGSVSVALRKLEADGLILRTDEKENRSQVWKIVEQGAAAEEARELVVHAGSGTHKGRRLHAAA